MITFSHSGSFRKSEGLLNKLRRNRQIYDALSKYGQQGVAALSRATPIDSGETRNAWRYEVKVGDRGAVISWFNGHVVDGVPIAIILQYGHGTGTGGYVQGRDYINPVMKPIFDQIADDVWKAVTSA